MMLTCRGPQGPRGLKYSKALDMFDAMVVAVRKDRED